MIEQLAVPSPFESVGDVAAGLAALDRQFQAARDLRGLFVTAYMAATHTVAQWIDQSVFIDNQAMARYVVAFGNEYRRALADWVAGDRDRIPVAWQQSFEACDERSSGVVQCLMLGINAHMKRDLPYAVIEAGIDVNCTRCSQDYFRIDDVMRLNIPLVRRRVADAYGANLSLTQRWFGGLADAGMARGFTRARRNSWAFAQLLAQAETASARAQVDRMIEEFAAIEGQKILGVKDAAA
jgi:hypothetical protein